MEPILPESDESGDTGKRHDRHALSYLEQSQLFRDYQNAFELTTGLPLSLRPVGSLQAPLHGSKRVNAFCALMAQRDDTCAACLQMQQKVEDAARRAPATLTCFAGLVESAVPVRTGETLLGYLQTGQVFLQPPTERGFKAFALKLGGTRSAAQMQELKRAYFQVRVVARSQYASIIRLIGLFGQHLSLAAGQCWTATGGWNRPP
jgi:hypothetical protein